MPTITYSRRSRYWRPICTNKLNAEPVAAGTSEPVARPCYVCVHPIEVPPVQNCWCTNLTRPGGVDSALILTLGGSFGGDSASGTFLSNSGSVTLNSSAGRVIPSMVPADGVKSSTITNNCSRQWTPAAGTTFVAKNLHKYVPSLMTDFYIPTCGWYALAGFKYYERVYHPTIVRTVPRSTFTYNVGFGLTTGSFHGVSKVKDHELIAREVTLDNNDPASVWLVARTVGGTFPHLMSQWIRAYVPQISNGMPFEAGGFPCAPVTCNRSCYPVRGFCNYEDGALQQVDGIQKTKFAYWDWFPELFGFYWHIRRYTAGVWAAWLIGRASAQFSTATYVKPRCNVSTNFGVPLYNAYYEPTVGQGTEYPLSYHDTLIPTWVLPGRFDFRAGGALAGTPVLGGTFSTLAFGGGMTGTARHPSWSGSIPTMNVQTNAPVSTLNGTDIPLAVYVTTDLPCNFSGSASMLKIADYRTAPNAATQPIYAGPTSFPATATLQF